MVRTIYISWRKKAGERRFIVARLKRTTEGIEISYTSDFKEAQKEGLDYFMGIKYDTKLSFKEAENLLSLRVISKDRPDRQEFLEFWEANNITDTFDLIALTQGKSPSDNVEFLADFLTVKNDNLKFVTDLAGLSHLRVPAGLLHKGDALHYVKEPHNVHDKDAVAVYRGSVKVGYIKQIHTKIFVGLKRKLRLTVKAVDENVTVKQLFVKVEK